MSNNYIKRVAIVGAGGQSGGPIARELVASKRFHVTALTRASSNSTLPEGLDSIVPVDYDDVSSLTAALQNVDALVITLAVTAKPETQGKLIEAAAAAGVPWVLPNEWGGDYIDESLARDVMVGTGILAARETVRKLGKSSYIAFVNGFWFEYSLAASPCTYGFDFANKKVTFYDQGTVKICTTTLPTVGRGATALLSLPIKREAGVEGACLEDFRDSFCYVSSFRVSQKDMFDSVLRVTGDKESDWTIEYEDVKKRYARGQELLQKGERVGFGMMLYSRYFWPEAPGDFESKKHNEVLGLKPDDLDEWTKIAVDNAEKNGPMF